MDEYLYFIKTKQKKSQLFNVHILTKIIFFFKFVSDILKETLHVLQRFHKKFC